jgi:tRNA(Ile)-lysidine synthase
MEENGLDHVEDSTNAKQDYTRNRLRHSVMPVLRQINPNVSGGIMDTKQLLSWDDDFIGGYAEEFVQNNFVSGHISARKLAGLHPAVAGRVVKKLCPGADFEHVKSVLELCKGKKASQSISVPGMTVRREYDDITFGATPKEEIEQRILPIGQRIQIPEINAGVRVYEGKNSDKIYKTFNTFLFKKSSIYGSIVLRSRRTGDKVNISGCTKQLKKLFIEKHIPSSQRQSIPVLADDRGVVAVFGMGIDRRCLSRKGDDVIIIEFEELI